MKITEQQFREELNLCLVGQGFNWYNSLDFMGLVLLGIIELHKDDIDKLLKEVQKGEGK
jgi:hypothetical protein